MSTNDWTAAANGAGPNDPIYLACVEDAKDSVGKKSNLNLSNNENEVQYIDYNFYPCSSEEEKILGNGIICST